MHSFDLRMQVQEVVYVVSTEHIIRRRHPLPKAAVYAVFVSHRQIRGRSDEIAIWVQFTDLR